MRAGIKILLNLGISERSSAHVEFYQVVGAHVEGGSLQWRIIGFCEASVSVK